MFHGKVVLYTAAIVVSVGFAARIARQWDQATLVNTLSDQKTCVRCVLGGRNAGDPSPSEDQPGDSSNKGNQPELPVHGRIPSKSKLESPTSTRNRKYCTSFLPVR